MIQIDVQSRVSPTEWNEPLRASPQGSVFQTTFWAEYARAYFGAVPHYLTAREDGRVVGQLLALEMPRGGESLVGRAGPLVALVRAFTRALSWREGPMVVDPARRDAVVEAFLPAVVALARRRGVAGIEESWLPIVTPPGDALRAAFERAGFALRPRATVRVDLRRPLDDIWTSLEGGVTRTPVRKAEKQGVTFRECVDDTDFERWIGLVDAWRDDQHLPRYVPLKFRGMREHMRGCATFFLAELEGQPVGGAGLWHFAGRAHLFNPAQSVLGRERRIYSGDFVNWEMIRWCHARGFEYYDLSWIPLDPKSAKEEGIRRFKAKWGAVAEYPIVVQALREWQWSGIDRLKRLRRRLALRGEGRVAGPAPAAPPAGEEA
jgi:hypothetical protein